ncbi:PorP/SprF family type IX secretion system membrane protein [Aurantibacillus circumpalustris]|uniref:PorP/SprF family type IX secretion system membrane protein n=1 Tax=Aurantibacillus circumpalustris TaxID=3036359 RepID=UPI00295B4604|nr:PorP/SprF family type IX secretion system membrane protein [Aurantibacillus circumpalustris]
MRKGSLYLIVLLFLIEKRCYAQDIHFSQYYLSPLTLNPANTGNYKGDYRIFGNYRSQWRELDKAYSTFSAGLDGNLYPKNINISPGLLFLRDRSANYLVVTKILPSIAIHSKIAGFKVHLGIQPGIVIKAIDFYEHSFPNQLNWNTGQFDKDLPNIEPNAGQSFTYFDLNAGVVVSHKMGKWEPEVGFAAFHLNQPRESFLNNTKNKLPVRSTINAAISYQVKPLLILKLYSLYGYTTKANDWVSGLNVEYILSKNAYFTNSVFAGFMWRDGFKRNYDAGIVTVGLNYSHYILGFSYDITLSQLKTSVDSKGAYEIALIYRAKNTRLTKKIIPCERY